MQLLDRLRSRWLGHASTPPEEGWLECRRSGINWRLDMSHWLDRQLYKEGVFEPVTTQWMRRVVQPGMQVLDVGANFGYFTALMGKLVGPTGKVWAFEPTDHFGQRVRWHIEHNGLHDRVALLDYGLSDRTEEIDIAIGDSSATLHPLDHSHITATETIRLLRLDDVVDTLALDHVDVVKVDVDGHEPAFLRGASDFLRRHKPLMLIEFFQGNLDRAGSDVRELKAQLEDLGYELRSEKTGELYPSRWAFLEECGNFQFSVNVWACPVGQPLPLAA